MEDRMAWIHLTDINGSDLFVNMNNVLWFSAAGDDGHAWLVTMANDRDAARTLHIKQTPAQVVSLLRAVREEVASGLT
jgi:hypothetical protein